MNTKQSIKVVPAFTIFKQVESVINVRNLINDISIRERNEVVRTLNDLKITFEVGKEICIEKDHSKFVFYDPNRDTNAIKILKLQSSISLIGNLVPIIVAETQVEGKTKFIILDGQNRFVASVRENQDILYFPIKVDSRFIPNIIAFYNQDQKPMRTKDYPKLYAESGHGEEYTKLLDIGERLNIDLNVLFYLISGGGYLSDELKYGLFKLTEDRIKKIELFANIRDEIFERSETLKNMFKKNQAFHKAVAYVMKAQNFNKDTFLSHIKTKEGDIGKNNNFSSLKERLEEIYNWNLSEAGGNQLKFRNSNNKRERVALSNE